MLSHVRRQKHRLKTRRESPIKPEQRHVDAYVAVMDGRASGSSGPLAAHTAIIGPSPKTGPDAVNAVSASLPV